MGVIVRRDIIVIFMCLEMMLSAANLSLVAFSRAQGTMGLPNYDGQALSIFILTIALLFLLCGQIEKQTGTLEINSLGGLSTRLPRMAFVLSLIHIYRRRGPAHSGNRRHHSRGGT